MLEPTVTISGVFEALTDAEQDKVRRAALRRGVAVEVLIRDALVDLATRINESVAPPAGPDERRAA